MILLLFISLKEIEYILSSLFLKYFFGFLLKNLMCLTYRSLDIQNI